MNDQRTSDVIRAVSVPPLLRVAEVQLARLAADGDEASAKALWKYVLGTIRSQGLADHLSGGNISLVIK
jgi:hypothetical protein